MIPYFFFFFFFNDTATTEIYTLSLHDALPDLERSEVEVTWLVFVGGHHEVLCKVHARFFRSVSEVVSDAVDGARVQDGIECGVDHRERQEDAEEADADEHRAHAAIQPRHRRNLSSIVC